MFFLSAKLEFGQNPKTESKCAGARVATWDLGFWNRSRTSSDGRFLGWDGMGMEAGQLGSVAATSSSSAAAIVSIQLDAAGD